MDKNVGTKVCYYIDSDTKWLNEPFNPKIKDNCREKLTIFMKLYQLILS